MDAFQVLIVMLVCVMNFISGYSVGKHTGFIAGEKATMKNYLLDLLNEGEDV